MSTKLLREADVEGAIERLTSPIVCLLNSSQLLAAIDVLPSALGDPVAWQIYEKKGWKKCSYRRAVLMSARGVATRALYAYANTGAQEQESEKVDEHLC